MGRLQRSTARRRAFDGRACYGGGRWRLWWPRGRRLRWQHGATHFRLCPSGYARPGGGVRPDHPTPTGRPRYRGDLHYAADHEGRQKNCLVAAHADVMLRGTQVTTLEHSTRRATAGGSKAATASGHPMAGSRPTRRVLAPINRGPTLIAGSFTPRRGTPRWQSAIPRLPVCLLKAVTPSSVCAASRKFHARPKKISSCSVA
jgi:hypothetical protein